METVLDRHHGCFPTAREAALNLPRSGLFPTWHSTRGVSEEGVPEIVADGSASIWHGLISGDGEYELPVADGSDPKKP
jgi:hypothetical protein